MAPLRDIGRSALRSSPRWIADTLVLLSVFRDQIRNVINSTFCPSDCSTLLEETRIAHVGGSLSGSVAKFSGQRRPEAFLDAVDDSPLGRIFTGHGTLQGRWRNIWRSIPCSLDFGSKKFWRGHLTIFRVSRLILAKLTRQQARRSLFLIAQKTVSRHIFLLWLPHTYASLGTTPFASLIHSAKNRTRSGMELMMRTVPTGHDICRAYIQTSLREISLQTTRDRDLRFDSGRVLSSYL